MTPQNLTALLSGTDSLSSLNDLVGNYPDFAATLASWENVTILAPSNDALETLMNSDAGSMLDNDEFVQSLLRYHVLNGTVYSSNITQTPIFAPTYLNSSMYSNVTGGQVVAAQMEDGEAQFVSGLKQVSTVSEAVSIVTPEALCAPLTCNRMLTTPTVWSTSSTRCS